MKARQVGQRALLSGMVAWLPISTGLTAPRQVPSLPYYDWGACPFECCAYRDWTTTRAVTLLTKPSPHASQAFRIHKNVRVRGMTGVVITSRYGITRILVPMKLGYTPKGNGPQLSIPSNTLVYTLHYDGEGYDRFWYRGHTYSDQISVPPDAWGKAPNSDQVKIVSRPKYDWWVKIKTQDGRIGWTDQTENFDDVDACG